MSRESAAAPSRRLLLAVVCAAHLMLIIDATSVSVALVPIGRELGVTPGALAWVVNGYTLTFGGFLLLGGRVADVVGRPRMFVIGLVGFGVTSALSATAPNPAVLIAARCGQGAAAAFVAPAAIGLLAVAFPRRAERARALAVLGIASALGGSASVAASGLLSEFVSWRWVFGVNPGVVLLVLLLARRVLPAPPAVGARRRLGLLPTVLGTAAMVTCIYNLQRIDTLDVALWLLPALLIAGFVVAEKRAAEPLTPLGSSVPRGRVVALLIALVAGGITAGSFFTLTLSLQNVWGWGAAGTGAVFVPFGLALFLGSSVGPALLRRAEERTVIRGASAIMCLGLGALAAVPVGVAWYWLLPGLIALALGGAVLNVTLAMLALVDTTHGDASGAGALLSVAQQLGGAVGVALVAVSIESVTPQQVLLVGSGAALATSVLLAAAIPPQAHGVGSEGVLEPSTS